MIAVIGAVIGAGIAGLQAAGQLQRLGVPFCVLEAGAEIGGLARTGVHQHWRYNDTRFLLVFLTQAPPQPWHWQFFADPRFPFYRLTYRHNFSNRFPPCLVAEVTDRGQPLPVREIVAALETIGIKPEWVAETREERLEFTYPIPTLRSEAEKPAVIAAFEAQHIYPLGRAGSWFYGNVDGLILQAWEKVPQIVERECQA